MWRSEIVTIKEVAQQAGVSISTVSHVVNGTRFVSDDLKARVLSSMKDLDYQPNRIARSLRRKQTNSLGLIISDITNPFFAEIAWSIENISFLEKYSLFLCNTNSKYEKEVFYINQLSEWQVDGIILISPKIDTSYLKILEERNIPVVLVDNESPEGNYDVVKIDNYLGGKMAADHLIALGHKRIACISGPFMHNITYERVEGYKDSLREHGLIVDEKMILTGNFDVASGLQCANNFFEMDERPTAIFACNDQMAVGVIQSAAAHNLKVPDDISLVGFDDINLSRYTVPPLTTISQPLHEIGEQALNCMIEKIKDPNKSPKTITLNLRLAERQSTKRI
ncbi:MAG: LacI family DNA-binding transcriptional regulator [Pelolinea sp.]|nr:LacI family DNA-binding transcriptional regulator [Pelolinea sp.]